ncbi:hypothetical protein OC835_001578 [Tilletia horrida]|nr:hypothetical protein OC835_001578 [Tilletia horrida]
MAKRAQDKIAPGAAPAAKKTRRGGSASKTQKSGANSASSSGGASSASALPSAAQRFFGTYELVTMVTPYLEKDRVDLLALAATNKALRVAALQTWAVRLDVPITMADKRLALFKANPGLARHVRYLRFYDDIVDSYYQGTQHEQYPRRHALRDAFAALLSLLATEPPQDQAAPFLDLAISSSAVTETCKVLTTHIKLLRRLVALRIVACYPFYCAHSSKGDPEWHWLVDMLAQKRKAASGSDSGLQTFALHLSPDHESCRYGRYTLPPGFWAGFALATSSTLRELVLHENYVSIFTEELAQCHFPQLQQCELSTTPWGDMAFVETFLDRHPGLMHLKMRTAPSRFNPTTFTLRQTFSNLQTLDLDSGTPVEATPAFLGRHAQLKRIKVYNSSSNMLALQQVPPGLESLSTPFVTHVATAAEKEARLCHIDLGSHTESAGESVSLRNVACTSVLYKRPDSVTCLELVLEDEQVPDIFAACEEALGSNHLPHLKELYLSWQSLRLKQKQVRTLFTGLCTATELEVVRLEINFTLPDSEDYLVGNDFPPKLKYVNMHHPDGVEFYFRFVPDGDARPSKKNARRGRLQQVPSVVHTIVTDTGVWDEPSALWRRGTVLHHGRSSSSSTGGGGSRSNIST